MTSLSDGGLPHRGGQVQYPRRIICDVGKPKDPQPTPPDKKRVAAIAVCVCLGQA